MKMPAQVRGAPERALDLYHAFGKIVDLPE